MPEPIQCIHPPWADILKLNGISTFEDLWGMHTTPVEPRNQRRGGWSETGETELRMPGSGLRKIYLKRQENHTTRCWTHPLRGEPTLTREWRNLQGFKTHGIPAPEPVCFSTSNRTGSRRAALITAALEGCISLDTLLDGYGAVDGEKHSCSRSLVDAVTLTVSRLHQHGYRYNSLYPKHILVRPGKRNGSRLSDNPQIFLIDLESARRSMRRINALVTDLDQLNRHSPHVPNWTRLRFLVRYMQSRQLAFLSSFVLSRLRRRYLKKQRSARNYPRKAG